MARTLHPPVFRVYSPRCSVVTLLPDAEVPLRTGRRALQPRARPGAEPDSASARLRPPLSWLALALSIRLPPWPPSAPSCRGRPSCARWDGRPLSGSPLAGDAEPLTDLAVGEAVHVPKYRRRNILARHLDRS